MEIANGTLTQPHTFSHKSRQAKRTDHRRRGRLAAVRGSLAMLEAVLGEEPDDGVREDRMGCRGCGWMRRATCTQSAPGLERIQAA
ncbi:general secretion pathway protein I [Anopheles sinensis]|uniref:General secretion pathway protein I n=1 Tax=Anopheles sinensis TaxID=74873 RepID=A0A084VZP7_ANOSI|nr:general secretion pathway protein I [Anopheles sinensis]